MGKNRFSTGLRTRRSWLGHLNVCFKDKKSNCCLPLKDSRGLPLAPLSAGITGMNLDAQLEQVLLRAELFAFGGGGVVLSPPLFFFILFGFLVFFFCLKRQHSTGS